MKAWNSRLTLFMAARCPTSSRMPAVHWALENLGKAGDSRQSAKRVYLAGSDYAFSRVLNLLIKDLLAAHGAEVVGEFYAPLKSTTHG